MGDTRAARRAAERAARERLAGPLNAAIGELGAAGEAQRVAADGVAEAHAQAREHVAHAKREAEDMVAAARRAAAAAESDYTDAHAAATQAEWGAAALADKGYPTPGTTRRPRREPTQPTPGRQPTAAQANPPAAAADLMTAAPSELMPAASPGPNGSA